MLKFDRRRALAAGGALMASTALPRAVSAAPLKVTIPPAPVARVQVVKDVYFGETLDDPYRWMENDKDPEWLPFLRAQNARSRTVLDQLPWRPRLLERIQALSGDAPAIRRVQRAGGLTFYEQRPAGADNYKLFVKADGPARVLIDPTALQAPQGGHMSLDWWRASPDGNLLVYGVSPNGSEDSVLHILKVADGAGLPETITNTEGANPSWLPDGSGFFYNQLTGAVDTPDRYLDSQARFHRVGTDPASDPVVMKRGLDPTISFERIQMPMVGTEEGSDQALLFLGDVRPEFRLYIAPLSEAATGKARWREIARFEDEVTDAALDRGNLYLIANKDHPRGRILRLPAADPDLAKAAEVVPQGPTVIETMNRARDGLYLTIMDGGVSRLRRLGRDDRVSEIALPFDGAIGGVYANPREDGALIGLTGWFSPPGVWRASPDGALTDTGLNPKPPIDTSPYVATRLFAIARDGVKIPYTLLHRKDLKRGPGTPLYIQAYGSYGSTAYPPSFNPRQLVLMDEGFVVGFANVRGGGEYGREWHKAGQLFNKPNTWRDLIAVCEDACSRGYSSPAHLSIGGRSAGGITVGRAMTERPDLFAAVIDGVGWSNPLRYVAEQNGAGEEPEWGAIREEAGYKTLKLIDSYQAVRDGTPYPAVFLTTGVTDPRVAPFHVGKMTARLQAASSSGKPILLRVDFDAGHGIGSTRAQQDREAADTYAFLIWRLTDRAA